MSHRILVASDRPSLRDGLSVLIEGVENLMVCAAVPTAEAETALRSSAAPHLVVAETTSPDIGARDVHAWTQASHRIPVLAICSSGTDPTPLYRAGAMGVLPDGSPDAAIIAAIQSVLQGHVVLPGSMRGQIVSAPSPDGSADALSTRQLDVLRLIGLGMTTTEIAARLDISPKTVETHRVHIKGKLNLTTANALIRWAALWVEAEGRGPRA